MLALVLAVLACAIFSLSTTLSPTPLAQFLALWRNSPPPPPLLSPVSLQPCLEQLAYVCYARLCASLPVLLRQWYLTLDRQTSARVAGFTTAHVSARLRRQQLSAVVSRASDSAGNMQVRANTLPWTIVCTLWLESQIKRMLSESAS